MALNGWCVGVSVDQALATVLDMPDVVRKDLLCDFGAGVWQGAFACFASLVLMRVAHQTFLFRAAESYREIMSHLGYFRENNLKG
jgi:hypothetical protein